jgi:CBS domain-containing protein
MSIVEHYRGKLVSVPESASVQQIATVLEQEAVGCAIVVDADGSAAGVVTDRDLALRVVASGRDPEKTTAAAIMSHPVVTVEGVDSLERAIEQMARHGIRRVPVTEGRELVGIVSLDDLLAELGSELEDLGAMARSHKRKLQRPASLPQLREELETCVQAFRGHLERAGEDPSDTLVREFDSLRERLRRLLD